MARPRCKQREAALARLDAFKEAYPNDPVPRSLLTYVDASGVRRYTVSGHDTWKSSQSASERYSASMTLARRNRTRLQLMLDVTNVICFEWEIAEDRVWRLDPDTLTLVPGVEHKNFSAVLEAVHREDRARFVADVEMAMASPEGRYGSEIRILNPDGSTSWYRERGKVERDRLGKPIRLIGVAANVIAQKFSTECLEETEMSDA